MLLDFNLILLFLYSDNVSNDKIVINAILKIVVSFSNHVELASFSKSASFSNWYSIGLL